MKVQISDSIIRSIRWRHETEMHEDISIVTVIKECSESKREEKYNMLRMGEMIMCAETCSEVGAILIETIRKHNIIFN